MIKAISFKVQNFRNIDDSGWIPLERVTAFVGRNESGKTALLKALHKFNPATPEPYNPQREFPRDRFTSDYENGADWPVCSVKFQADELLKSQISEILEGKQVPEIIVCTRYYDGNFTVEFEPDIESGAIETTELIQEVEKFAGKVRRLEAPSPEEEDTTQALRTDLAGWASGWKEKIAIIEDLRSQEGITLLSTIRQEIEQYAKPITADIIESLLSIIDPLLSKAKSASPKELMTEMVKERLPVFIYFDNYGILDSAIYLPEFLNELSRNPNNPRVRTINAMFKHVNLTAKEIHDLGIEQSLQILNKGQQPSDDVIKQDQKNKELRSIKLNSASLDITNRFNQWYGQRRHSIDYQADGNYFRIWVADDRRPGVKVELEDRSKGFQWFFSFYLVFLVESEEGHKDAVLLLDEPGLNLHPTAQQELITFFENLSEKNQLLYTTHSPFLIDGEHIHRVRPVTEDDSGHSRISIDSWPKDRETIFPLQAAAGYAMVRGLFRHKKNILVEGMSEYYYLHALAHQCHRTNRLSLPDDVYITPCGGTKLVGHIASLFLGQEVCPLVLLDGDDAGRVRRDILLKELYAGYEEAVVMLDEVLGRDGDKVEIEDILGEDIIIPAVSALINHEIVLFEDNRKAGSLPDQIRACAKQLSIQLPDGWKPSVAIRLVSDWAEKGTLLDDSVLDRAALLFETIRNRFDLMG